MDLENYRNFLAIVEAGSMTAASEFIHIAQPALSKQLKTLEAAFGTKLIITTRGSKHLILTDAGKFYITKQNIFAPWKTWHVVKSMILPTEIAAFFVLVRPIQDHLYLSMPV